MIDLRSDTITQPSDEMRDAISHAIVGDDVYHDDPTVNALESMVADLLGKEAAMYVPTGTMSNQIAVRMHTQPGDSIVLEASAHIGSHEMGGVAHHSGVTLKRIAGTRGVFTAADVRATVPVPHPSLPAYLYEPHTLLCVENTHNEAGGTVWSLEETHAVTAAARDLAMATHLDGARLWNTSAATETSIDQYAAPFDTVSVCFSKGLGAPVGSALVGDTDFIEEARRFKQMFGGGMRQSGLLAAGAIYALENNRERLVDDHANALAFARFVSEIEGVTVDLDVVHTNIVYFNVNDPGQVVDSCLERGLAMLTLGTTSIRAVFHLGITPQDSRNAAAIVADAIGDR
ncbi:MAG: beta-eliminating lyase-related protein [Actinomycetia bacterium]|nr:beta-eliminating lyase-related protein [Actinomycetes bacterium]